MASLDGLARWRRARRPSTAMISGARSAQRARSAQARSTQARSTQAHVLGLGHPQPHLTNNSSPHTCTHPHTTWGAAPSPHPSTQPSIRHSYKTESVMDVLTFANTKQSVPRAFDAMRGDPKRPHLMGLPLPSESAMRRHRIRDGGLGAGGGVGEVVASNIRAFLQFLRAARLEERRAQERLMEQVAIAIAGACISLGEDASVDTAAVEAAGRMAATETIETGTGDHVEAGGMQGGGGGEEKALAARMLDEWTVMARLDEADAALARAMVAGQLLESEVHTEMLGAACAATAIHLATTVAKDRASSRKSFAVLGALPLGDRSSRILRLYTDTLEVVCADDLQDDAGTMPIPLVNLASVQLKTDGSSRQLVCELYCTSPPVVFDVSSNSEGSSSNAEDFLSAEDFLWMLEAACDTDNMCQNRDRFLKAAQLVAVTAAKDAARAHLAGRVSETLLCSLGFDECDLDKSLETDRNFRAYGDVDLHVIGRDDPRPAQRLYARIMTGLNELIVDAASADRTFLLEALAILSISKEELDCDVVEAQAAYDKRVALYEKRNSKRELKRAGIKTPSQVKLKTRGTSKTKGKSKSNTKVNSKPGNEQVR